MKTNKQQVIEALCVLQRTTPVYSAQYKALGSAIEIVKAVMLDQQPQSPAIPWKPIDITHMQVGKYYLIWGKGWNCAEIGYVNEWGNVAGKWSDEYNEMNIFNDATHYAEINGPEVDDK